MRRGSAGFTLAEAVVVIVIVGILAATAGQFMVAPVRSVVEQSRRAALTDAAALALVQLGRDLRAALPNSVRVSGGSALELLLAVDGERYRADAPGAAGDRLDFTAADSAFNTLGRLGSAASYANHYLAIYPLGQPGGSPYADAVMTPAETIGIAATASPGPAGTDGEYRVTLSTPHKFPFESPAQRVYLVSGPVSWFCAGGVLTRHSGYAVAASQPATPAATGVTGIVAADQVESCSFNYDASSQRRALVTVQLTLASSGERVRLLRQVHVENTP
jgi:MSHA biogenesis protein MshO